MDREVRMTDPTTEERVRALEEKIAALEKRLDSTSKEGIRCSEAIIDLLHKLGDYEFVNKMAEDYYQRTYPEANRDMLRLGEIVAKSGRNKPSA
jgi:hypothetical protein